MDIRLALMTGIDIPVPECQVVVHQPRLNEIAFVGEEDFFVGAQCLCMNKTMFIQDEAILAQTNNFQIFITVMQEAEAADKKFATQQTLSLLFPGYNVSFTPRSLLLMKDGAVITIDENNFDALQETLRAIFCFKSGPMDQTNFNPADAKAKEIADKLMRGRQRVAAQSGETKASIFTQYISTLTVGLNSMRIEDCINLTMYQLYDLVERYMLYVNWDLDIRSRLAGAKGEGKPDNWMKNIH